LSTLVLSGSLVRLTHAQICYLVGAVYHSTKCPYFTADLGLNGALTSILCTTFVLIATAVMLRSIE